MKLTEYVKKGYGLQRNVKGVNQGAGVINNPKGNPATLNRGGRTKVKKE